MTATSNAHYSTSVFYLFVCGIISKGRVQMLLTKEVSVKWNGNNQQYYINKGYIKNGTKTFLCRTNDLPNGSHALVDVMCDDCGKIKNMSYRDYIKVTTRSGKYLCRRCTNLLITGSRRIPMKDVVKLFTDKGYTLLTTEYERSTQKLEYICSNHPDEIQTTTASLMKNGGICKQCWIENRLGNQNGNWKGGICDLNHHLRQLISPWVWDSLKEGHRKCILTGSKDIEVHHKTSFNSIVRETLDYLKLPIKSNIGYYTQQELTDINNKCLQLHIDYGLGVCLDKTLHTLFHSLYGRGDNTPEQFEEFVQRYKSGEFTQESEVSNEDN